MTLVLIQCERPGCTRMHGVRSDRPASPTSAARRLGPDPLGGGSPESRGTERPSPATPVVVGQPVAPSGVPSPG